MPLLKRKKDAHKGDFGHVLIVAGSPSMLGAAALSGLAAMRSGAGMTTIAVAKSLNLTLQKKISNVIMTRPLPETSQGTVALKAFDLLKRDWQKYSAVVIGPGMTTFPGTVKFVRKICQECPLPMVLDADALNSLAIKGIACGQKSSAPRILTPHPGEMSRLTGLSVKKIQSDRKGMALKCAKAWGCVIVLKGHQTVVASTEGKVFVNTTGNSALATAGSGDVLTGILVAFLAQGLRPFDAAKAAVFLHGRIGDKIVLKNNSSSLIASDLIEALSQ